MVTARPLKNPFVFGAAIGIFVIFINISIVSIAEGSLKNGYSVFLDNGIYAYLIPLSVGVQMGLFRHHRNITAGKRFCGPEKIGITGSITSSAAMVLCCLHHAIEVLPAAGFVLATSSFLTDYKDAIIGIGLFTNLIGSAFTARAILKEANGRKADIRLYEEWKK